MSVNGEHGFITWDQIVNVVQYWTGYLDRTVMAPNKSYSRFEVLEVMDHLRDQMLKIAENNALHISQSKITEVKEAKNLERDTGTETDSRAEVQAWKDRTRIGRMISTRD